MNEENIDSVITKGKRIGIALFTIGFVLLMMIIGGWNLVIFFLSQVFLTSGLIIWVAFLIRERKRHPVHEPKWAKHIKQ